LQSNYPIELVLYYVPKMIGGSREYQFFKPDMVFNLSYAPQVGIVNSQVLEHHITLQWRRDEINMFTGIVEELRTANQLTTQQSIVNLATECDTILCDIRIGDSICVSGVCLTVVCFDNQTFSVHVIKGTENKTYLNPLNQSDEVNLERAMSGQGRFGGHFVLGHTDEVAKITRIQNSDNSKIVTIKPSKSIINQMVQQGSITIDGVS